MNWLTTSLLAFAAAVVGWLATDFVASPVRRFFNLRIEIIRRMTQFANVRARWKELRDDPNRLEDLGLSEKDQQRLEEAQSTFRDLASQMRGFAQTEWFAVKTVQILGYDPLNASAGLLGLSNTIDRYGGDRALQAKNVRDALRISEG